MAHLKNWIFLNVHFGKLYTLCLTRELIKYLNIPVSNSSSGHSHCSQKLLQTQLFPTFKQKKLAYRRPANGPLLSWMQMKPQIQAGDLGDGKKN